MKHTIERFFYNLKYTCLGAGYAFYEDAFKDLLWKMRDKKGGPFIGEEYHHLTFVMNLPLHHEFCTICEVTGHDSDMYRGIKIVLDYDLDVGDPLCPSGIVRLVYEESGAKRYGRYYDFWTDQSKIENALRLPSAKPHIDHVIFNGPATIVFWKDGTKTVVKHDGKGRKDKRQAILYAFIRKIYGEGKPYHNILNEIEEAVK